MPVVVSEQGLFQACQTLFGIDNNVSREFLEYLQLPGIKSAYRKKAFETHPDRAALSGGEAEEQNAELFRAIQQAYEDLTNYLDAREKGFRFSKNKNNGRFSGKQYKSFILQKRFSRAPIFPGRECRNRKTLYRDHA